jgi:hypothetical protein
MALTDFAIRNLKASERPQKLADGGNMYLYESPAGGKLWRVNYRFLGKQKTLSRVFYHFRCPPRPFGLFGSNRTARQGDCRATRERPMNWAG